MYAYPPGSRTRIEKCREGSRRVEEGQGRTSPVDDHRKCFSCFSTNACACDYCNRALCAFIFVRVPASMLIFTRGPSSTILYTHRSSFEPPSTRTAKSKLVSLSWTSLKSRQRSRDFFLCRTYFPWSLLMAIARSTSIFGSRDTQE